MTITSLLTKQSSEKPEEVKGDSEMKDQTAQSGEQSEDEENTQSDKHCLFQNDNYYNAVINAVWHGKKIPSKKQVMMENRVMPTRRG